MSKPLSGNSTAPPMSVVSVFIHNCRYQCRALFYVDPHQRRRKYQEDDEAKWTSTRNWEKGQTLRWPSRITLAFPCSETPVSQEKIR